MNIEKIIELKEYLEALPDEQFDHNSWGYVDSDHAEPLWDQKPTDPNLCGTSACICGHLAIMQDDAEIRWESIMKKDDLSWDKPYLILTHRDYTSSSWHEYGRDQLGLTYSEATAVFLPSELESDDLAAYFGIHDDDSLDLYFEYRDLTTTKRDHAIEFLSRMIEHKTVDPMWWAEIKSGDPDYYHED